MSIKASGTKETQRMIRTANKPYQGKNAGAKWQQKKKKRK
jgi:hypothetical protein